MEQLTIREAVTRRELKDFIFLPEQVHAREPEWLHPIYADEKLLFDKKRNKSYRYADTIMLLAYRGKRCVGRVMGIVNRRYNEIHGVDDGRFCFMECYNERIVYTALMNAVEAWLREQGMKRIIGPLGFSDKDPQGFQVEGFKLPQVMTSATNSPYMALFTEKGGFRKKVDLVNYVGKFPDVFPEVYERVLERVNGQGEYKIVEFGSIRELRPHITGILEVMNQSFSEIYGFVPLNDGEKMEFANRYLPVLDPKFVKIVMAGGRIVAFAIGIPDLSEGIRAVRGRLFPLGFLKVMRASKRSKKLLMMLGGVCPEYRGKGLDVLMGVKILKSGIEHGMEQLDSHLVLEDNARMRSEYERVGCEVVKRFRIYEKDL
ncbi:MAG: hypothetical protein LBV26_06655 [Bacteroidales bacterium]|jgi:hypothetical protein|nr:hypothetical protein [Bacteroidales bacterium]